MKLLHTSDWHLGRSLYDRKRYNEFEAFLYWLLEFITDEKIDILLVAGDVFDTTTPGNRAQELYYQFLSNVSKTCCRHVVIIGGNHDSPTFLDAPKNLLTALDIHVVGASGDNLKDEVFLLKNKKHENEAIVCAVPFLRDRDIRTVEAGESINDKNQKLLQGIASHYKDISAFASTLQDKMNIVPVIGMGHLFTREGKTTEGDGVRDLYIGSLAHVDGKSISEGFDYMALGHLHLSQIVGGSETMRYSGSPIPMGFAEAGQIKKVVVVEFNKQSPVIIEHQVPCFQELIKISGDVDSVFNRVEELKFMNSNAWLEIEITSQIVAANITSHLDEILKDSNLEILRIKNRNMAERALHPAIENETLDTLADSEVFNRCLDAYEITDPERGVLIETYKEVVASMINNDSNAN